MSSLAALRARSLFVASLAVSAVACDLGSFSLGAGPDREDPPLTGGASGSGTAGSSGTTGGNGGTDTGGAGSPGTFGVLMRVSGPGVETEGNGDSYSASITSDGRFIVYESTATNLVPGDTNREIDVFLFDRLTASTGRISTQADGTQAEGASFDPAVSADGTRVVFSSYAPDLYPVEFSSGQVLTDTESDLSAFPYELTPIIYPDASSSAGFSALTSDGSSVVFASSDPNIVPNDVNGRFDFFVYDVATGRTERVVTLDDGSDLDVGIDVWRPEISADASYLAFSGGPLDGPRRVYVVEVATGAAELVSVTPTGEPSADDCYDPSIGTNGRLIAFVCEGDDLVDGDTNGLSDIFVRDLELGVTERVSVTTNGAQAQGSSSAPALSGDGRRVVFQSNASNLGAGPPLTTEYGALVSRNRVTGETWRFTNATDSGADAPFEDPTLTPDGRFLTFETTANGLLGTPARARHVYLYQFIGI